MSNTLYKIGRDKIRELLAECTQEQQDFFNKRVYPNGIDSISDDRVEVAIGLCERTIKKNHEKQDD